MINILITMAGAGKRFAQAGFTQPKPLIPVLGKTIVEWAMQSFDFLPQLSELQIIFVVLEEHIQHFQIDQQLKKLFPSAVIISLPTVTGGQAETALAAKSYISNQNRLFIYNCDTFSLSDIWTTIQTEDPDGIIPCFESQDPRYSYVKVNAQNYAVEVAEKQVISNFATIGMYYFKQGSDFVSAVESMIAKGEKHNNEFYIGPAYNQLIKQGKKIKMILVKSNWVLGTPEELENFSKNYH